METRKNLRYLRRNLLFRVTSKVKRQQKTSSLRRQKAQQKAKGNTIHGVQEGPLKAKGIGRQKGIIEGKRDIKREDRRHGKRQGRRQDHYPNTTGCKTSRSMTPPHHQHEKPIEEATILVVAPSDLHPGFQFVATSENGAFVVTGKHRVG